MVATISTLDMSLPYQFLPDRLVGRTAYYGKEVYSHESKRMNRFYTIDTVSATDRQEKSVYVVNLTGTWSGENVNFARRIRALQFKATLGINYTGTSGTGYGIYLAGIRLFVGPTSLATGYYDLDTYPMYLELDAMPVVASIEHQTLSTEFLETELVYPYPLTLRAGEAVFIAVSQYQVVNLDNKFTNNTITAVANYDIKFLGR